MIETAALTLLLCAFAISHSGVRDADAFCNAVRTALEEYNRDSLDRLTYRGEASAEDRRNQSSLRTSNPRPPVKEVTLAPLPEDFQSVSVARGVRIEPTARPLGLVRVSYHEQTTPAPGVANRIASGMAYTVVDGEYFLVAAKTTKLPWSGPEDRNLSVMITGKGQDEVILNAKYNASGVDLERRLTDASSSFLGQYIEELTARSDHSETDVTVTIKEGDQQVYKAKLSGTGVVKYQRQEPPR